MTKEIRNKMEEYKLKKDILQYRVLLAAADLFIATFSTGVSTNDELDLGIGLFRELVELSYIGSLRQFEHEYELQNEILVKKIKVFKLCIPSSHERLRGLTEMLIGMKENELG